jgi:hypothetical protein
MGEQGHVIVRKVPPGWERDAFIAQLQSVAGVIVIVTDMTDCPSNIPTNVIVKRASGEVAGWSMTTFGEAVEFARKCNELVPSDPAHVVAWDDSAWDDVLGSEATS